MFAYLTKPNTIQDEEMFSKLGIVGTFLKWIRASI